MKVVINGCHGGFGLSEEAVAAYIKRKGLTLYKDTGRYGLTMYYTVPVEKFQEAYERDAKRGEWTESNPLCWSYRNIARDDPDLVAVVESLGKKANGEHASLRVVDIPDGVVWQIEEYDGSEWVAEAHSTWS